MWGGSREGREGVWRGDGWVEGWSLEETVIRTFWRDNGFGWTISRTFGRQNAFGWSSDRTFWGQNAFRKPLFLRQRERNNRLRHHDHLNTTKQRNLSRGELLTQYLAYPCVPFSSRAVRFATIWMANKTNDRERVRTAQFLCQIVGSDTYQDQLFSVQ